MGRGIVDAAAYLPAARITAEEIGSAWGTFDGRGIESKAVPAADEDATTMAIAAGRQVLQQSGVDRNDVAFLGVATTTPPLEEEAQAPRIARALGLPDEVETSSSTQNTAAGGDILAAAVQSTKTALVLIADLPEGELAGTDHAFGAGAAAFLIDENAEVEIIDSSSFVEESTGIRYRQRGAQDVETLDITTYERDAMAECVAGAVDQLDVADERLDAAALPQPDGATPARIAGALDVPAEVVAPGTVVERVGDAGAATVAIGITTALEQVGANGQTLAVFFGSGGNARGFLFEGALDTGASATLEGGGTISYSQYLRQRGYVVDGDVAGGGANVSVPTWQRTLDQRYRLVAGRCTACGEVSLPPEGACPGCHERSEYEPVQLPRNGTVLANTVISQGGAPPEFNEFQERAGGFGNAIVEHRIDGETVKIPGQITDADPDAIAIGDEVEAVVRRLYVQEGLPRYGVKYVPAT